MNNVNKKCGLIAACILMLSAIAPVLAMEKTGSNPESEQLSPKELARIQAEAAHTVAMAKAESDRKAAEEKAEKERKAAEERKAQIEKERTAPAAVRELRARMRSIQEKAEAYREHLPQTKSVKAEVTTTIDKLKGLGKDIKESVSDAAELAETVGSTVLEELGVKTETSSAAWKIIKTCTSGLSALLGIGGFDSIPFKALGALAAFGGLVFKGSRWGKTVRETTSDLMFADTGKSVKTPLTYNDLSTSQQLAVDIYIANKEEERQNSKGRYRSAVTRRTGTGRGQGRSSYYGNVHDTSTHGTAKRKEGEQDRVAKLLFVRCKPNLDHPTGIAKRA